MAQVYVLNISIGGARAPTFTQQPASPVNYTVGISAVVNIPFATADPNPQDTVSYSVVGLTASVSAVFLPGPVLRLTYVSGVACSSNITIVADDGTGPLT